jgi:hypothetical protein
MSYIEFLLRIDDIIWGTYGVPLWDVAKFFDLEFAFHSGRPLWAIVQDIESILQLSENV